MGSSLTSKSKKSKLDDTQENLEARARRMQKERYDDDSLDAANLVLGLFMKQKQKIAQQIQFSIKLAIRREDFTSNVELRFQCDHLLKTDTFSMTDPMLAIYQEKKANKIVKSYQENKITEENQDQEYQDEEEENYYEKNFEKLKNLEEDDNNWEFKGLTEVIPDCICPKFMKSFIFRYNVEDKQRIKVKLFDVDDFNNIDDLSNQNYLAIAVFSLYQVMCSPTQQIQKKFVSSKLRNKKYGTLTIRGQDYDVNSKKIQIRLGAKDFLSKHDIIVKISCLVDNRDWYPIYSTDLQKNQKKSGVQWEQFNMYTSYFGSEDKNNMKIQVAEVVKGRSDQVLGEVEISIQSLIENSGKTISLYQNSLVMGEIILYNVQINTRTTFLSYVLSGSEISLIVAVDCTNSNKDINDPSSLHKQLPQFKDKIIKEYRQDEYQNIYEEALHNIVGILQYFDADNKIPFYGFGAKLPPYYSLVSHCFAMNGNYFQPNIVGATDLVNCYRKKISQLQLHGPTALKDIIQIGKTWADSDNEEVSQLNQKYYVLLIITDGVLNDMESTIESIIDVSSSPLSIIIVNLSQEENEKLKNQLDPSNTPNFLIESQKVYTNQTKIKRRTVRDCVQYFNYNDFKKDLELLARECLRKLPKQFLHFMDMHQIKPTEINKDYKFLTREYMHKKIDQEKKMKKKKKDNMQNSQCDQWLIDLKEQFITKLKSLKFQQQYIQQIMDLQQCQIACPDVNLFIELLSYQMQKQENLQIQPQTNSNNVTMNQINKSLSKNQHQTSQGSIQQALIKQKPNHRVYKVKFTNKLDKLFTEKKNENIRIQNEFLKNNQQQNPELDTIIKGRDFINQSQQFDQESKSQSFLQNNQQKQQYQKSKFNKQNQNESQDNSVDENNQSNNNNNEINQFQLRKDDFNIQIQSNSNLSDESPQINNQQINIDVIQQLKLNEYINDQQNQEESIQSYITPSQTIISDVDQSARNIAFINDKLTNIPELMLCLLCEKRNIDIILIPCGHASCCSTCFRKYQNNICPNCNYCVNLTILLKPKN